jgi:septal ring factor EnvC (AmiA/AmiB activator)
MPWWSWLAFGIFLLALVATAVFSVFAFGRLKRLGAAAEGIQARLDEVAHAAEEVERRMAHAQERLEELERHRARTEASIARLKVLTTAFSEATGGVLGARRRYLRK